MRFITIREQGSHRRLRIIMKRVVCDSVTAVVAPLTRTDSVLTQRLENFCPPRAMEIENSSSRFDAHHAIASCVTLRRREISGGSGIHSVMKLSLKHRLSRYGSNPAL